MAKFPDLNKDGKITQADILMGRGVKLAKGGRIVYKEEGEQIGVILPEDLVLKVQELLKQIKKQRLNLKKRWLKKRLLVLKKKAVKWIKEKYNDLRKRTPAEK